MIQIGQVEVSLEHRQISIDGNIQRIGCRAFDILELLILAKGALVSKDEIMRRVWPTTIVEENNLQVHVATLRKLLGQHRDLILTVPGRGYRLLEVGQQAGLPAAAPASEGPANPPSGAQRLAGGAPELIGRHGVIAEVIDALGHTQILTLVGTGGIGKTRLALEVGARSAALYPDGVLVVPFASVGDARFALDALATALGMTHAPGPRLLGHIAARMAGRAALIVLDNCEHVIDAAAQIAVALAGASPGVRVLATSREALRARDEVVYRVPPLAVPSQQSNSSEILQTEAVQLFLARARAVDPRFSSDERSIHLTGLVCRRLDGLPLAIELAAARAGVLGIQVLADHLDDRFRVLSGGFRTAVPRHQTLKATLDWSYRLLDDTERMLLRWLGVFLSGFSFDGACHVVESRGISSAEVLDALGGLVSKSLVIHESAHAASRYRLLETTRAYALQQLADNGEQKAAARAHALYFRAIFDRTQPGWSERPIDAWFTDFRRELGNLRTALDWAFSPGGDPSIGIELASVVVPYLFDMSLVSECCERARAALEASRGAGVAPVPADILMRLTAAVAAGQVYTDGPTRSVREAWSEVLALAVAAGDAEFESRAVWGLWNARQYGGEAREALVLARRFGSLARQPDGPADPVIARRIEAIALHYAGEQRAARREIEAMLAAYVPVLHRLPTLGFRIEQGVVGRATLARILWVQGETAQALSLAQCVLEDARRYGHEMVTAYVLVEALVPVALLMEELEIAAHGLTLLRNIALQSGFAIWLACCDCFDEYLLTLTEGRPERLTGFAAALDRLRSTAFLAPLTMLLARFARARLANGQTDAALAAVGEALRHCEGGGEGWYYAELCRVRGEIALALNQPAEAQAWFKDAFDAARRQGAGALARLAAGSLVDLLRQQGRHVDAGRLLATCNADRYGR